MDRKVRKAPRGIPAYLEFPVRKALKARLALSGYRVRLGRLGHRVPLGLKVKLGHKAPPAHAA